MSTNLVSIVYVSSATKCFSRYELIELLELSRINNARNNITGMLLYKGGTFIQVLEGIEETVMQLYQKILQDARHNTVVLLSFENLAEHQFPDWSMGFQNIDEMSKKDLEAYSRFLDHDFTPEYFRTHTSRASVLLQNFKAYM